MPSRSSGVARTVRTTHALASATVSGNSVSATAVKIMNVNRLPVDDSSAADRVSARAVAIEPPGLAVVRSDATSRSTITLDESNHARRLRRTAARAFSATASSTG